MTSLTQNHVNGYSNAIKYSSEWTIIIKHLIAIFLKPLFHENTLV